MHLVVIMDLTSLDTDSEPYVSDARKILKYFEQVNFFWGGGGDWCPVMVISI